MVTLDYLRWYQYIATKNRHSVTVRGTYQYLLATALNSNGAIKTSQDVLASELATSKSTITRSLKILVDDKLIKYDREGGIQLLAPAVSWLEKYCTDNSSTVKAAINCTDKKAASITRAQKAAPVGNPTQPPMGGRVTPTVLDQIDELNQKTLSSSYLGKSFNQLMAERGIKLSQS